MAQVSEAEIIHCNEITEKYGLVLTAEEVKRIVEIRNQVLKSYERIELGGGMVNKLIIAFCDSPYIHQDNYAVVIEELLIFLLF